MGNVVPSRHRASGIPATTHRIDILNAQRRQWNYRQLIAMPTANNVQPPAKQSGLRQDLGGLEDRARGESLKQSLSKPVSIVGIVLALAVVGFTVFLEQDPTTLRLEIPEVRYELMRNEGLSDGVPIAIRIGKLMVFQISDPISGNQGALRAKQVVESLSGAVNELAEDPPRVITIENSDGGNPAVVQREYEDSGESLKIVTITEDDLLLAKTDDSKLLARLWAERLTDTMRLLLFGQAPEFSRSTPFGAALDTLYVNAINAEGSMTTHTLETVFNELPVHMQLALTEEPPAPPDDEVQADAGIAN